jgi:PKD repeat protein
MRSSRVFSFVTGAALLAACGGDSNGPSNAAPTAAFNDPTCSQLTCTFSGSPSTDGDGTIAGYAWDFGDPTSGQNSATTKDASHSFSAANTYSVKLTVTDNAGAQGTVTKSVTVSAPAPGSPTAAFTVTCSATDCTVADASTDVAPGALTGWHWDFGDDQTSDAQTPPAHHYDVTAATPFTITLTVTDNDGLTGSVSHDVSVAPAAGLTCSGEACALLLPQASTVVVTLVSHDCEVHGNTFVLTAPVEETLFTDGCYDPITPDPLASHPLQGGAAFDANTELSAEVRSGFSGTTSPQLRVSGDYASGWTLEYDDGFVGPGEPDFNDLVITVKATPVGP